MVEKNLKRFRYADDTVLIAHTERELEEVLDMVVKERAEKGLTINCKKKNCMVVSKRDNIYTLES